MGQVAATYGRRLVEVGGLAIATLSPVLCDQEADHPEGDAVFTSLLTASADEETRRPVEMEAADWLVGLGIRCGDVEYAQVWFVRLGRELPPGSSLLGLVGLCLGHLARRFGALSEGGRNMVEELAERHRRDPADVDGRAADGLDDMRMFLA